MFNYFSFISSMTINLVFISYYIVLLFISVILMFISLKLITDYRDFIVDEWIFYYIKKIWYFLHRKFDLDRNLYKEVYNITHTKINKFINIFYYFSIFYLCCKTCLILELGTNNFEDEITMKVIVFCIRNIL